MVVTEEMKDIARKAIPLLRESNEPCVEIEGGYGLFLCNDTDEFPSSYVKLATISASDDDSELFSIFVPA